MRMSARLFLLSSASTKFSYYFGAVSVGGFQPCSIAAFGGAWLGSLHLLLQCIGIDKIKWFMMKFVLHICPNVKCDEVIPGPG